MGECSCISVEHKAYEWATYTGTCLSCGQLHPDQHAAGQHLLATSVPTPRPHADGVGVSCMPTTWLQATTNADLVPLSMSMCCSLVQPLHDS